MEATTVRRGPFLERRFSISERGSTPRVEVLGGVSTFLTFALASGLYYAADWLTAHVF
jgi:hypothetical protein